MELSTFISSEQQERLEIVFLWMDIAGVFDISLLPEAKKLGTTFQMHKYC
jgi:hypothetical protein